MQEILAFLHELLASNGRQHASQEEVRLGVGRLRCMLAETPTSWDAARHTAHTSLCTVVQRGTANMTAQPYITKHHGRRGDTSAQPILGYKLQEIVALFFKFSAAPSHCSIMQRSSCYDQDMRLANHTADSRAELAERS